uniref:Uncharacterized protein n=1 Tax=Micrurus surinamensis TaxID=129470 RepID=A0A2D4PZL4_MICSU
MSFIFISKGLRKKRKRFQKTKVMRPEKNEIHHIISPTREKQLLRKQLHKSRKGELNKTKAIWHGKKINAGILQYYSRCPMIFNSTILPCLFIFSTLDSIL